ncbi:MAG: penicillin-binding protein [Acidobacteria bacterium]|nr:penicillin-binding protein [Acidobacteriota bacterium]
MFFANSAQTRWRTVARASAFLIALLTAACAALATPASKTAPKKTALKSAVKKSPPAAAKKTTAKNVPAVSARKTAPARSSKTRVVRRKSYSRWTEPTYADSTVGDLIDGEDLVVRRAAVEALGLYNGTVVAVDSTSGRVLTMVNQKVALTSGFIPCSTVKVAVGLAALSEGVIGRDTPLRLTRRTTMDLTEALALSNNPYFARLGEKLGYERFAYYARLFGMGEKAGLNVRGEQPGVFPEAPPKDGGMGMMTSFGTGISLTPLELAAFLAAISNGGTLYWLQYPESQQEVEQFVPRVKRRLDIARWIPDIKPGLTGAVEYGTARRAMYSPEAPICGKTGTCTGGTTHLGWFGAFNDFGETKMVVVVLMTGGQGVSGPNAAEIAGNIYRQLHEQRYFARRPVFSPALLLAR